MEKLVERNQDHGPVPIGQGLHGALQLGQGRQFIKEQAEDPGWPTNLANKLRNFLGAPKKERVVRHRTMLPRQVRATPARAVNQPVIS